ncbi:MAG TPA: hypothetical protein HA306_03505 [Methanosarcina sp.]|nr:hypothetical protein [Methanosarcina sp.]
MAKVPREEVSRSNFFSWRRDNNASRGRSIVISVNFLPESQDFLWRSVEIFLDFLDIFRTSF